MDIPTTASTVINCTKSDFGDALRLAHAVALSDTTGVVDRAELNEVIDGLVRQANQHRGTFTGYSAYLDCQFTVTPDDALCVCDLPVGAKCPAHPDAITIPAVTGAQRIESMTAVMKTVRRARTDLAQMLSDYAVTPEALDTLGDALKAAAGHLRIASGER